ncbi:MAG: DUF5979 domain-containing protein [Saccharofermentans sp.]|nr:DUF5979 domain-containing protein [Saccharofermentans sp.]
MFKFAKRATSAVIAGAVVFGTLAFVPVGEKQKVNAATLYDSASAINYATILGGAVDYGIVADSIEQKSHMETSFATNHFTNNLGFNDDVDYIDSTALFLINELDSGKLYFGKTTASSIYLEGNQSVFGSTDPSAANYYDPDYQVPAVGGQNGNLVFGNQYGNVPVIQAVNPNAYSNVNRLINRISTKGTVEDSENGWSYFISDRANDDSYALDLSGDDMNEMPLISYDGDAHATINLTSSEFDGKVVYINIDKNHNSNLVNYLGKSSGLIIDKNESSVVVFNIEDDAVSGSKLVMEKPVVRCNGKNHVGTTAINGDRENDNYDENHGVKAADVQRVFNQTVVWNVMTSKNVEIVSMGGTMLFPLAPVVDVSRGNTSGWIVAKGKVNVNCEFHFLYGDSSKDLKGEMHFALTKSFTKNYAAHGSVLQETSVAIPEDTYQFSFEEYVEPAEVRGDLVTLYPKGESQTDKFATSNGAVTFDSIRFTCEDDSDSHYNVPKGTDKMFYFKIKENAAAGTHNVSTSDHRQVTDSDGYIDIRLKVSVDSKGNFTYFVDYKSVSGDGVVFREYGADYDDKTNPANNPGYIKMSGVQFDLGAFYNKVADLDQDYLDITKTVGGDVDENDLKNLTFKLYEIVQDDNGKDIKKLVAEYIFGKDFEETSAGSKKYALKVKYAADKSKKYLVEESNVDVNNRTVTVSYQLPGGTVTDINGLALGDQSVIYESSQFSLDTNISYPANNPYEVAFTNDYENIIGELKVKKELEGVPAADYADKEFKFTVKTGNGPMTQYVQADGKLGNKPYEFTVTPGTVCRVPIDSSVFGKLLSVTEVGTGREIEGYQFVNRFDNPSYTYSKPRFDFGAYGTSVDNKDEDVKVTIKNKYMKDSGSIVITKTIEGPVTDKDINGLTFEVYKDGAEKAVWTGALGDITGTSRKFSVDDIGKYTSEQIWVEEGNYYVVEKLTTDAGTVKVSYKIKYDNGTLTEDYEKKTVTTEAVSVKKNSELKLDFTNTYTGGSLVINKALEGAASVTSFPVTVMGADGIYYDKNGKPQGTSIKEEAIIYVPNNSFVLVNNLPIQKYTVSEVDPETLNAKGYRFSVADSKTEEEATLIVGATPEVNLKNVYKVFIDITKTFGGDITGEDFDNLTFELFEEGNDTAVKKYTLKDDFTEISEGVYALTEKYKADATKKYYVKESNYDVNANKSVSITYKIDGGKVQEGSTTESFAIAPSTTGADDLVVAFTNEYTKKGALIISKTISDAELNEFEKLSFSIVNANNSKDTIDVDDLTIENVKAGTATNEWHVSADGKTYTYRIEGLKAGETYIVKETYDGTGDSTTYKLDSSSVKQIEKTIVAGGEVKAELTDKYVKNPGSLIISKTISGAELKDFEKLSFTVVNKADSSDSIKVDDLTTANVKSGTATKQWHVSADGKTYTYEIDGLEAGKTYVVKETYDGTDDCTTYELDSSSVKNDEKTIVAGGEVKAELTDTYNKNPGVLIISKTISIATLADFEKLTFTVVNKADSDDYIKVDDLTTENVKSGTAAEEWHVSADGKTYTYRIEGLEADKTYIVTETYDGTGDSTTYKLDSSSVKNAEKTIVAGGEVKAELTDKYVKNPGSLIISKTISGAELEDFEKLTFTVVNKADSKDSIKVDDLTTANVKSGTAANEWHVSDDGKTYTYRIDNLEAGKTYVVKETYDGTGDSTTYELDSSSKKQTEKTIVAGGEVKAELTDKYVKNPGSLIISKTISGADLEDFEKLTFTVVNKADSSDSIKVDDLTTANVKTGTATKQWHVSADGKTYTYKIDGLDAGKTYVVTETYDGTGDSTTYELDSSSKKEAEKTIVAGGEVKAELTDKYVKNPGSLIISKTISGADLEDFEKLTFTVVNKADSSDSIKVDDLTTANVKSGTAAKEWHVSADGKTYTYRIDNLEAGKTYVVTETYDGTGDSTTYELDSSSVKKGEKTIVAGGEVKAELTDKYNKKVTPVATGSLVISKTISGADLEDFEKLTFTVVNKADSSDSIKVDDLTTANVKTGTATKQWHVSADGKTYTYEIDGLDAGKTYVVTETYDGTGDSTTYELDSSSVKKGEKKVVAGGEVTVELTDKYNNKATPTPTNKVTATPTPTNKPTATPTSAGKATATPTPTATATATPTSAGKATATPTPTATPTSAGKATETPTPTATATPTPAGKATETPTPTATATPTSAGKATETPTPTPTSEVTVTPTPTSEVTVTPTPTSGEVTVTPTPTGETTVTPTPTGEVTVTPTPTEEPTPTPTEEPTPTPTEEPTPTETPVPTPTETPVPTPTETPTPTPSDVPSPTPTDPSTETPTPTPTDTEVISANREKIPATGEQMSYYAIAGVMLIGMCAAILTGLGVYRKKKDEF